MYLAHSSKRSQTEASHHLALSSRSFPRRQKRWGRRTTSLTIKLSGCAAREALLAFVAAAQDVAEWTTEAAPKRADFRAWSELICNVALAGAGSQKERRHLFKSLLAEAWVFANWLTHTQSATWYDAEVAQLLTDDVLGLVTSLVLRYIRSVSRTMPCLRLAASRAGSGQARRRARNRMGASSMQRLRLDRSACAGGRMLCQARSRRSSNPCRG